jgi:adenine-specific DNA-methyltransferase
MRFIGSKILLLKNIEYIISQNIKDWKSAKTFCDIFSGTTVVSQHFKKYFKIISNDLLYFSYVMQKCYIENNIQPEFKKLDLDKKKDIYFYLNSQQQQSKNLKDFFVYKNYSPNKKINRQYLTNKNAAKIDLIRLMVENWKNNKNINLNEYYVLLSSLIEAVPFVSNIAGTYGAYLKNWDNRSLLDINLKKPNIFNNKKKNISFNEDANNLIKKIEGDILYLDPPYNSRQYLPNYHLLETIAKYDNPILKGKTGMRDYSKEKSLYCQKSAAEDVLFELVKNANFSYIVLSYSTDGIINETVLEKMFKKFSKNTYRKYRFEYRRYKKDKEISKKKDLYELMFVIDKK